MSNDSSKSGNWFARHKVLTGIGVVVLFFILIGALAGDTDSTTSDTASDTAVEQEVAQEERIKVTATELYRAYEANEIAADNLFADQKLEITGVVDGIGKDILDSPYVTLDVGEYINNVQCMLASDSVAKAGQLKVGTMVTLHGENPSYLLNVLVKKCSIVE